MTDTFPARLKETREARKLTQDELGEMVGANRVAISRYESGTIRPNGKRLAALADALDVTVEYLMGGDPSEDQEEKDEAWVIRERMRRDPNYRILFKAAETAKPEHLRAAAAMIKALEGDEE